MKASEIRQTFLEYFKKRGHTVVDSSRLVPEDDPTLLFTNSGMVQFKNVFLGLEKKPYTRATTAQKCVRAGGKHNDLDNVGHTARHHTFFEMMGNFSFGDYFKKEAIQFAWDLLINHLHFPKDKLWVTVFRDDDEAFEIWHKQEGVPKERISRFGEKDNFWQMADTGPCGPCSEIFYDHGPQPNCPDPNECRLGCSCDRYVEIWNLVFMQFNRDESGKLHPLPKPSVDTGAGLERLAAALQKVPSNYDTDVFQSILEQIGQLTGHSYANLRRDEKSELAAAMRVVADHSRAAAFLISDGVLPSNEGQGYVLRRILRRGLRYGRKLTSKSFFVPVVTQVIEQHGAFYKELEQRRNFILTAVAAEEEKFLTTLDTGTELFNRAVNDSKNIKNKTLSGEVVFKLYDTYGFPSDLTRLMAQERGLAIDEAAFEQRMQEQRETAKAGGKFSHGGTGDTWAGVSHGELIQMTQDLEPTKFLGYESLNTYSKVLLFKYRKNQGLLVTRETAFYAEGGGQVGDQGHVKFASGEVFKITDTRKINGVYLHFVLAPNEIINPPDVKRDVVLEVSSLRQETQRHHSATHLLHAALRKILGNHVHQEGSLVESHRLRFDFSHPKAVTAQEISTVENLINDQIARGLLVNAEVKNYSDALKSGAVALFGEKYGDEVRVLAMGDFSTELCGGTHVRNTSDIRVFKILKESGVSSGVRRIEAITGNTAIEHMLQRDQELAQIEGELKIFGTAESRGRALEKIQRLQEQIKKLERDLKNVMNQSQALDVDQIIKSQKTIRGITIVSAVVTLSDRDSLSELSDKVKDKIKSGVVVLIGAPSEESPACPIVVGVTKDKTTLIHAGNLLKEVATVMGGKGGGRPDFAQGSGPDSKMAQQAAQKAFEILS